MIGRRELLIGAACVATAGTAYALKPRERVSMLNGQKLEALIPHKIGAWKSVPSDALIIPEGDDSLAAKLYSQTVARLYVHPNGQGVMLLIAYGDTQSDQLQLHRPEVCYPAFGFNVSGSEPVNIEVAAGKIVTGRNMTASSAERVEHVTYWTRIGEELPASGSDQRTAKFQAALQGKIPDGVLVRISSAKREGQSAYSANHEFARALLGALSPVARKALVGTALANGVWPANPQSAPDMAPVKDDG